MNVLQQGPGLPEMDMLDHLQAGHAVEIFFTNSELVDQSVNEVETGSRKILARIGDGGGIPVDRGHEAAATGHRIREDPRPTPDVQDSGTRRDGVRPVQQRELRSMPESLYCGSVSEGAVLISTFDRDPITGSARLTPGAR